jgi:hypothetical protein
MKSSFFFNWFTRLAVLGAVVAAGAFASTAGAVERPPDIQDIAGANPGADVSRPPDTGDVAARLSASVPDVFERYAAEHPYGRGLAVTPVLVTRPPDVQDTADSVNAASPSDSRLVSRPVDRINAQERARANDARVVGTSARSAGPVAAIIAQERGRRLDQRLLSTPAPSIQIVESGGFHWNDWGIGIGTGMGLVFFLGGVFLMSRQLRHPVQPA